MSDTPGHWGDVRMDSYLRDKNGVVWRVCTIDDQGYALVKNRHNQVATLPPRNAYADVTFVSDDDEDACVALLRDKLGAEVMGVKPNAGDWILESWPEKAAGGLDKYREHLFDFHGVYANDITGNGAYKRLSEAHRAAHNADRPGVGEHPIPHAHPFIYDPEAAS